MRRVALPLLLAAFAGGCSGLFDSAQIKRAREFVEVEEFESARKELTVELHNNPDSVEAKSLLLFMQIADPASGGQGVEQCLLVESLPVESKSTAAEESLAEAKIAARKAALDRGIETTSWDEFEAALRGGIVYGWKTHAYAPDKMGPRLSFAFCAALQGDDEAKDYLVDHLAKDDTKDRAASFLYLLGDAGSAALEKAAASPENLSRDAAEATLRNMRLARVVSEFAQAHKDRVSPNNVRTGSSDRGNAGKYLMGLGWKDDNEPLRAMLDAALARQRLTAQLAGEKDKSAAQAPVVVRTLKVGTTQVALLSIAESSASSTASAAPANAPSTNALGEAVGATQGAADGAFSPAGINTTFLTAAWSWDGSQWKSLTIDGKPSISGMDQLVLQARDQASEESLGADQLALVFYRGIGVTTRYVNMGWYGRSLREFKEAKVERNVYHLGAAGLEFVKTTQADGSDVQQVIDDEDSDPLGD